jgi:hypothetical protein
LIALPWKFLNVLGTRRGIGDEEGNTKLLPLTAHEPIIASCQTLSSENYEPPEQFLLSDSVREKALELFDHEEELAGEKYDFEKLFARILSERDWTDKLASILNKIRNIIHLRNTDTKLSGELSALIPDMNEVAKAYDEMTNGYKEFIQTVLKAKNRWHELE